MQAEKGDLNSMQITDVRVRKVTKREIKSSCFDYD